MSTEDPWGAAPAEEAPAEEAPSIKTAEAAVLAIPHAGGDEITMTFKEGRDFDSSWIVIRAASVAKANAILDEHVALQALMAKTKAVAGFFRGAPAGPVNQSQGAAAPQQQSRAPQGAQEAPGGEERFCNHGKMVFKSGISKAGNAYKLFSCTAPRESQCKAQYLRD